MIFVLMPPGVKVRVRVAIIDAKPVVWRPPIPFDGELGCVQTSRRIEAVGIEDRFQLFGLDTAGDVLDGSDMWNSFESTAFELPVQVGVRITYPDDALTFVSYWPRRPLYLESGNPTRESQSR